MLKPRLLELLIEFLFINSGLYLDEISSADFRGDNDTSCEKMHTELLRKNDKKIYEYLLITIFHSFLLV